MQMKRLMYPQLAGQGFTQMIAPIIEIAGDDERCIMRNLIAHVIDQGFYLRAATYRKQAKMHTQAMDMLLFSHAL